MNINFSRIGVPKREEKIMTESVVPFHKQQKSKSKDQKTDILLLWKTSDLSQSAFCRIHKIKLSTFNAWLKKEERTKKEDQKTIAVDQKQIAKQSEGKSDVRIEAIQFELKFPNGCCLTFPSQSNMSQVGLIARELLCEWN